MNKFAGFLGVLALGAVAPLARADFQILVNGVPCTTPLVSANPNGSLTCPPLVGGTGAGQFPALPSGVTITELAVTGLQTTGFSQQLGSTLLVTNTTGSPVTITIDIGDSNFSSPVTPPNVSDSSGSTLNGTTGSNSLTLTSCVNQANSLTPTATAPFCSSPAPGMAGPNPMLTVTGPGTSNNETNGTITSLASMFSLTQHIVLLADAGADFNFTTSQVLNAGPSMPQLTVVKTADSATVTPGSVAGFTVTISNTGSAAATGVMLSDPLPAGAGSDINWMIDTMTGNPTCFILTGAAGSQMLTLNPSCSTLNAGASLQVHITGLTTVNDVGAGSSNPALNVGGVSGYTVLYEGTGGHNLQITNVSIGGNIGVGGAGHVQYNGPGTIGGRLDFSAANTGQYSNNNGSNVGPTSVNYNVAAVTTALTAIANLNSSLGGLSGTNITFNNNSMTINESAGTLQTAGGITYRVFNVTSYSENNGHVVTINGDGSGDPVVFNFGFNSNVNLGGDVVLTGLTPDQVIWNFATSGKNINLNNNASSFPYPTFAFQGVILAPDDNLSVVNASLIGRVLGGDSSDMQIVSGDNIHTPPGTGTLANTATVSASNVSGSVSATATITLN